MGEKFNQARYINEWKKENMKKVGATFKNDFVEEFKTACKDLDLKQSDVIREAMQETIDKANLK